MKKIFTAIIISICAYACEEPTDRQIKTTNEVGVTSTKKTADHSNIPDDVLRFIKNYYQREYKGTKVDFTDSDTGLEMIFSNIPNDSDDYDGFLIDVNIPKKENVIIYGASILFGDLDNNNSDDLIVGVHTEGGGTGGNALHSTDLFVFLNNNGVYEFISMTPDQEIADNSKSNVCAFFPYKIENGLLIGSSTLYQNSDPTCCPSLEQDTKVKFSNNKLVFESKGKVRKIKYDQ